MLDILDLHATVEDKPILNGITLTVPAGEVHAIMGPNGSGKSTLSYVLAGRDGYHVTGGDMTLNGQSLLELEPEDRAARGLFLAFQYPVEVPGVPTMTFLKTALNALRKSRGEPALETAQFTRLVNDHAKTLGIKRDMLRRTVNTGFSGGEKKRMEVLQMAVLNPAFCILDETDSGLDIDALRVVADGVNALRGPERGMLVITHYQRLLDYIVPDRVHVLAEGRIQTSGGPELARDLEARGYGAVIGRSAA